MSNMPNVYVVLLLANVHVMMCSTPIAVNTWAFTNATEAAWSILSGGGSALDAVEIGCSTCEKLQCDGTVGFGGSPDENGETTLDALIMDAETHNVGAVGCLRRVKQAVSVARAVLEHTSHTMLVGELATQFARQMGFHEEDLSTPESRQLHLNWSQSHCQPNFWMNVWPDPRAVCGPYIRLMPTEIGSSNARESWVSADSHDTIGMLAIDSSGKMAAATSTNGAIHKIPGRVGDSPIPGAGGYADRQAGGAVATGDGDIMMRFLPSLVAVERMRSGSSPAEACREAMERIVEHHPHFSGAVLALSRDGNHGAACHGLPEFPYSVASGPNVHVVRVKCI